jgi:hypothetical protein
MKGMNNSLIFFTDSVGCKSPIYNSIGIVSPKSYGRKVAYGQERTILILRSCNSAHELVILTLRPAMAFLPTKYDLSPYIRKNLCGRKIPRRMRSDCLLHRLLDTARGHVCCEDPRPTLVVIDTVGTPAPLASHLTKPLTIHQSLQSRSPKPCSRQWIWDLFFVI